MDHAFSVELENDSSAAPATDPRARARARVLRWIRKHDVSWFAIIGLLFLAVNSATTICRSIHEPATVIFVVISNVDIILLYLCMNQFETASAKRKETLKGFVWILATLLTGLFCHRVAGMMPPAFDKIIWGMAAVSISGSFYALFVYKDAGPALGGKV